MNYSRINSNVQNLTIICPNVLANPTSQYNLRNQKDIPLIPCCISLMYNLFPPSTIRAWNKLTYSMRNAPSLNALIFFATVTLKFHLHTRLRNESSFL